MRLGAIEGGGTTFELAVGTIEDEGVREEERASLPTRDPETTLDAVTSWLREREVDAVGLACFGPLDLERGVMLATPKGGWEGAPLRGALESLNVPIGIDTDVNAAALAENRWGAARGHDVAVYVTVGTGVGGGLIAHGQPVHGAMHPEMGHLPSTFEDGFGGACPFHGRCIEGLTAGPAIFARTGRDPASLPSDHPVWATVGTHLGELAATLALVTAASRIVFGGGVVRGRPLVADAIDARMKTRLGGYLSWVEKDSPVRLAELERPGVFGAFALADAATR